MTECLWNLEEPLDGPDRPACGQHVQTPCINAHVEQQQKERNSGENQKNETREILSAHLNTHH